MHLTGKTPDHLVGIGITPYEATVPSGLGTPAVAAPSSAFAVAGGSPLSLLIDKACGVDEPPKPRVLTAEEKEACAQLGRDVLSDLRFYYPNALAGAPKTAAIHLRNTVAAKAEMMLRGVLENKPDEERPAGRNS